MLGHLPTSSAKTPSFPQAPHAAALQVKSACLSLQLQVSGFLLMLFPGSWHAIYALYCQPYELLFTLQNQLSITDLVKPPQRPGIWASSSWLHASILQASIILYFKNCPFIFYYYLLLFSSTPHPPPECVLLWRQITSPSFFWLLIRYLAPSRFSENTERTIK